MRKLSLYKVAIFAFVPYFGNCCLYICTSNMNKPMNPFLKQVAEHYHKSGEISSHCFIFPNRRSMVFFRKYLSEAVAGSGPDAVPLVAPKMMTINDFFIDAAGVVQADRITLLLMLYECYSRLNPKAETLDDFIFWGDVMLGDFNDVDKYLADPKQLFTNISDLKDITDDFSYLTDTQREAIESFARHFRGDAVKKEAGSNAKDAKATFAHIWNLMYPLYCDFRTALKDKGMAYEGMIYRQLADRVAEESVTDILGDVFGHGVSAYVFVGLNALNECEKAVMRKMRDASIAQFCWDYVGDMISDPLNKSSYFMSNNVKEFKQQFKIDQQGVGTPEFNVVRVPSTYGQAKHINGILKQTGTVESGTDCSIVLPDEGLLMPLLNSIPPEIKDINVTMGYPMSYSELWSLMSDIAKMQVHVSRKGDSWRFYHKPVWDVFSNGLFRKLLEVEGMEECREQVKRIKQQARYYVMAEDLQGHPLLDVIFRPVVSDLTLADTAQIKALADYQQQVVSFIAPKLASLPDMSLEIEFAKEYWCAVNRLRDFELKVLPLTYIRLLESLLSSVAVPFKGEPLKGLQVMGPLETRALDFRNVIIMSCNEGVFPRRNVSSSFIPPELRKGFGLPTYEYQDAVWAYYFYRLITRAENVWLLYDSRTEGLKNGEESRYIKQLRYHFGVKINEYVAEVEPGMPLGRDTVVEKNEQIMEVIRTRSYSPSAISNYISCPMKFYYVSVERLKKDQEVSEQMDAGMIGNVYHNTMWALMTSDKMMLSLEPMNKLGQHGTSSEYRITRQYLESWLDRREDIKAKVEALMCEELGVDEITGRSLVVCNVIVRYVIKTIACDLEILKNNGEEFFTIVGLEHKLNADIYGVKFFGVMDRIDRIGANGPLRLVDYKSGKDSPSSLSTRGDKITDTVKNIFASDYNVRGPHKATLQFFIYDKMLEAAGMTDMLDVTNSMYATTCLFSSPPEIYGLDKEFAEALDQRLDALIKEICNPDVPFTMTENVEECKFCDFRMICGR